MVRSFKNSTGLNTLFLYSLISDNSMVTYWSAAYIYNFVAYYSDVRLSPSLMHEFNVFMNIYNNLD